MLSERAKTLLLNALGLPEVVDEVVSELDEGAATDFLKVNGTTSPTASMNWLQQDLTNVKDLYLGAVQYRFKSTANSLILQSSVTSSYSFLDLFSFDSDGTDQVGFGVFAKGTSSFGGASEFMNFGWRPDNSSFTLETSSFSGGSNRPLVLRTGANTTQLVLNTNGTIAASGQVTAASLGVGNSAAASTPGTVTKKIEIFNASGISLGFIAVYDAIS